MASSNVVEVDSNVVVVSDVDVSVVVRSGVVEVEVEMSVPLQSPRKH